jgi:hypothetical protein
VSAYIKQLKANFEREQARQAEERAGQERIRTQAARERLTPLEERLRRLLDTIPRGLQAEGLPLAQLQASLRGRWRGACHPGELGTALRKLGFIRRRQWRDGAGFGALWYPGSNRSNG